MKIKSPIIALASAFILMLSGCARQPSDSGSSVPLTGGEPNSAASVSTETDDSDVGASAPAESNGSNAVASAPVAVSGEDVGLDAAKSAALKHAGVAEADAFFTEAKLEYDDGRAEYDIEFTANAKRYEYEIRASDGEVLEFSSEAIPEPTGLLSESKAKELALTYAGFSEEQVTFTKSKLDYDGGVTKYEVEFTVNGIEYEIELDAETGEILKSEIDRG